jgi:hypothetical protein
MDSGSSLCSARNDNKFSPMPPSAHVPMQQAVSPTLIFAPTHARSTHARALPLCVPCAPARASLCCRYKNMRLLRPRLQPRNDILGCRILG